MERMFHTPEGVRDVYNSECEQKLVLEERLHTVLRSYGYQDIETPTFEYFDVFSREVGTIPSKDLYKFFDREGNTLVLRPDFTPSIARAVSMYFTPEELPLRLCYKGNTFINNSSYQGRLKESTQMGVEFIGDGSPQSDGEILALMVELLQKAGLKEFQISIGQVDFFKSLLEDAGMDEETEEQIRSQISNKNYFGVEELISNLNLAPELENAFLMLPKLYGGMEMLEEAKKLTKNSQAIQALERLEEIYEILTCYGCEKYVSFDLSMLSKYQYYTGIIFQAYTYGTGDAIIKGGRYNHLLGHFGNPAEAIGFTIVMENLMSALSRQGIEILGENKRVLILYDRKQQKEAISMAASWRKKGGEAELVLKDPARTKEDYEKRGKYNEIFDLCAR
jgi:ATP phosphoribosyltransferase regulatory subunit